MMTKLLVAWCVMAACVVIHAGGLTSALRWLRGDLPSARSFWQWTWLFIGIAGWMIVLHVAEISSWALVFYRGGAMPDAQAAFYFSAVTYTTTGYGDLVLPPEWRLVGGVEALTGILMCGWSTAFFVAAVSRMYETRSRDSARPAMDAPGA
jgi:hypothetical protein